MVKYYPGQPEAKNHAFKCIFPVPPLVLYCQLPPNVSVEEDTGYRSRMHWKSIPPSVTQKEWYLEMVMPEIKFRS